MFLPRMFASGYNLERQFRTRYLRGRRRKLTTRPFNPRRAFRHASATHPRLLKTTPVLPPREDDRPAMLSPAPVDNFHDDQDINIRNLNTGLGNIIRRVWVRIKNTDD